MATIPLKAAAIASISAFVETKYAPIFVASGVGTSLLANNPTFIVSPMIVSVVGIYALFYGFLVVGRSRGKAIENAKKDGEKDVDERYALPNLYVQGTSKHAKIFNCIQRSHQQIFETYTLMCVCSPLAAITFPLSSAFTTLMYAVGRVALTQAYGQAEGDATKRYSNKLSTYNWIGIFATFCLSTAPCISVLFKMEITN